MLESLSLLLLLITAGFFFLLYRLNVAGKRESAEQAAQAQRAPAPTPPDQRAA